MSSFAGEKEAGRIKTRLSHTISKINSRYMEMQYNSVYNCPGSVKIR